MIYVAIAVMYAVATAGIVAVVKWESKKAKEDWYSKHPEM